MQKRRYFLLAWKKGTMKYIPKDIIKYIDKYLL